MPLDEREAVVNRLNGNSGFFDTVGTIGSASQIRVPISFSRGTYAIVGTGTGIGGSVDNFTFASTPAAGDGSIIARISSLANTGTSPRAGIMIRSSTAANAAFAAILATPSNGLIFSRRLTDGGATSQTFLPGVALPRFLKLTREGSAVSVFQSADGATWSQFGSTVTVSLGSSPRIGLAATASSSTATTTAQFTHMSVLLPPGTDANDLGASPIGGYANYSAAANTYTISSSALDASGSGDELSFFSRSAPGEGSFITTIDGFTNSPTTADAGLMVRSALAAGSTYASVTVNGSRSVQFRWRSVPNGPVSTSAITVAAFPISLKLERTGNVVRAFSSTGRVNWTPVGSAQSITYTSSKALGGLAVRSGTSGSLATARVLAFSQLAGDNTASFDLAGAPAGSSLYDSTRNTHTLAGRGIGFGAADSLTLVGKTMSVNGDVAAYLSGFNPTGSLSRAGIMLRAATTANSAFAGIFLASTGLVVQSRGSTGGPVSSSFINGVGGPVSLKLTRVGNGIAARYSTDGVTWINAASTLSVALGSSPIAAMAVASGDATTFASASFTGFDADATLASGAGLLSPADEAFLNDLEARSVAFYWTETNPNTGMVPDGANASGGGASAASSIASTGFGLSALVIADERGFLTHDEAYGRVLTTLNFLYNNAAQVNGFFYHFLNPTTGARVGTTELSPIDTALLMAGVLHASEHWAGTPIATVATNLYNRVNWPWMQRPDGVFYGEWTPENGFRYGYGDFSEAVLLYLLGLGSPTHPTSASSWNSWSRSPVINYGGSTFITAQTRALFTVQYPLGWFDLRGKVDTFGLNYFDNAAKATLAQRTLGINLSGTYPQFGANVWGWTAADGPNGYTVWGGPPATTNFDGSVVPTAPGGSIAFTPRRSLDALRTMQTSFPTTYRKYGFVDAFNPHTNWTSQIVLGIDVGMMVLAAENARSGAVWSRFMDSSVAQTAMTRAFGAARVVGETSLEQPVETMAFSPAPRPRDRTLFHSIFGESTLDC